jgi:NAD(P)-dependent dehydrogenase (short-subunit alcohol dehydrogenase family)
MLLYPIGPGYIDTPLMGRWLRQIQIATKPRRVLACHPLKRIGTPRDVAEAVFFLTSEAAAFISGATLVVDGAMSIAGH